MRRPKIVADVGSGSALQSFGQISRSQRALFDESL
jgi:hypothetical protein